MERISGKAGLVLAVLSLAMWSVCPQKATGQGQKSGAVAPKTASQQFKNIQILKDIPADQLIPTMQFISASLGVECEFCHVEHQMDKDDKKEKGYAREMMKMQFEVDRGHFDNKLEVTCYTCHRGSPHPVGTPILSATAQPAAPHEHEEDEEAHAILPTADQILDKYLRAMGGADALLKIKTRVQTGTIDATGRQSPIEVYSEAPNKRVSISHINAGSSVTAYNGEIGWLTIPGGVHRMTTAEQESANIDAQMYFAVRVREMYKELRVHPGEEINGQKTYLIAAPTTPGHPAIRMYFDQESGLLLRLIRYTQTALGNNPAQVDYSDYRKTDGVKIPYCWTLARPNGAFTIRVDRAQQNVPIDQKLFEPPNENPPAAH